MRYKSISIHSLLILLTGVLTTLLYHIYGMYGSNSYINYTTILFTTVLAFVNIGIVIDSKANNNSMLLVLSIWNLMFCVFRIITLNVTNFSNPFLRCDATVSDVNKTLIVLILSSLALWLGLHYKKQQEIKYTKQISVTPRNIRTVIYIFWITLLVDLLAGLQLPIISGIATFITGLFLRPMYVFYFFIVYFVCNFDRIDSKYSKIIIASILFYVLYRTLGGSRSGIYVVAKMLFFVTLVIGVNRIKLRTLIFGVFLIPVVIFIFAFTTFMRRTGGVDRSLSEKVDVARAIASESDVVKGEEAFAMLFDRLGYFDYACEMVTRRNDLSNVVNIASEFKSIVDNALTPTFDIFDQARMSNVIDKYYTYNRAVRKSEFSKLDYQSDELTLAGEAYLLFFPPFNYLFLYLIGLFLKRKWRKARSDIKEIDLFYKAILLYIFETALSSYGIDWIVLDIVSFFIIYILFNLLVFKKSVSIAEERSVINVEHINT